MDELRKQFEYYLAHQDEFVSKYNGEFIVVTGEQVVGHFEKEMDAYVFAREKFEPGTFMIQRVSPGGQDYSQTFHSRAVIPG